MSAGGMNIGVSTGEVGFTQIFLLKIWWIFQIEFADFWHRFVFSGYIQITYLTRQVTLIYFY